MQISGISFSFGKVSGLKDLDSYAPEARKTLSNPETKENIENAAKSSNIIFSSSSKDCFYITSKGKETSNVKAIDGNDQLKYSVKRAVSNDEKPEVIVKMVKELAGIQA